MHYFILGLIILFIPCSGEAQQLSSVESVHPLDQLFTNSSFPAVQLENTSENAVTAYLQEHLPLCATEQCELQLQEIIESPAALHYTYRQTVGQVPVYGSQVKANVDHTGLLYALFDLTFPVAGKPSSAFPAPEVVSVYLNNTGIQAESLEKLEQEEVYFPSEEGLTTAIRLEILTLSLSYEVILDRSGKVIYYRDLTKYAFDQGKDSLVHASVFLPDPLTTANKSYGTPYEDLNDSNLFVLNAEMVSVTVPVNFDNGIFSLNGPYVKITNYKHPSYQPATSTLPSFSFNRSEQAFEDINVYYHIHVFQEYVQALGFNNLANYQIHAETHAYNTDNSTFVNSFSPPRLNFGEGGVDDGEDADVIIHEYGHALQASAAPGSGNGNEKKAIDEGSCDYLAASYSRGLNDFNWGNVFSWDGHNEFFSGRLVNSSKHYPQDIGANYHFNGEIWASALMEIWTALGKEKTDQLVLQSFYGMSSNMSMSQAAMLILLADQQLFNGNDTTVICDIFNARGFSTSCNNYVGVEEEEKSALIRLSNTASFARGGAATLFLESIPFDGTAVLYDLTGHIIRELPLAGKQKTIVSANSLPAGLYLLTVRTAGESNTFKLIRH